MGLSLAETARVSMLAGGFPESLARPRDRGLWFSSYICRATIHMLPVIAPRISRRKIRTEEIDR
jgi:hypothetical protein